MPLRVLLCLSTFFVVASATAQQVRFNEAVSSNSQYFDEDGDTPDWFELYNDDNNDVFLNGWSVTDNIDQPDKWIFPNSTLEGEGYLLIWASGKDRTASLTPRTLIKEGDLFRYTIPIGSLTGNWRDLGYNDAGWQQGATGLGYGDGDDATSVPTGTRSVYLRKTFTIANVNEIEELILDVDYDDAFVAYINGQEVARANISGNPPAYNATANTDHEANMHEGGNPDRFVIGNFADALQAGENVLSIQVHNVSSNSSDMSIIPFLSAYFNVPTNLGSVPPALLQLGVGAPHTNFKIASETETLYLFDDGGSLVDSLLIENLHPDISVGIPLGGNDLAYFDIPTPGLPNDGFAYNGISNDEIVFSHPGGLVGSISLTLSGVSSPAIIRYTLDATEPDENAPIYTDPISITSNTVVRARVFRVDYIPSRVESRSYLVNVSHELPVISLVTEPDNFFDEDYGIYVLGDSYDNNFPFFGANFWEDWERPIHFTLYEQDGSVGLSFNGGTKVFGGYSRGNDQRSLSVFARNQYGTGEIDYPLFPNRPYSSYQAFVLRNSGNDWLNTMMRDGILTGLMKESGLDYQAYRPAVTYLNGQYWGFYNIREKVNEHFLASRHNLDPEGLDLLEGEGITIHGDSQDYHELINFVSGNSLTSSTNYDYVADKVDIENYIIYQVAQIYFDNTDWPGNNIKYWRAKNGKWKWILYDTDFGFSVWGNTNYLNNTLSFALESNGPGWPNPPWSTLLFRRLVQNLSFRNDFINRFADELNSRFLPENVCEHIDTTYAKISSEIAPHFARWGGSIPYHEDRLQRMKGFANFRPNWMKQHILNVFDLPAYHTLTIQNDEPLQGYVKINRLTIKETNWSGDYFEEVPVSVVAIPEPGYIFSHWSGGSSSTNAEIEVNLSGSMTLLPHFEPNLAGDQAIVINEINYHSADWLNTDDWVEIYNPNPYYINLSGWLLKDEDDTHNFQFPAGTILEGNGYLVVAQDVAKFKEFYPDLENVIGDLDFGLSSDGDAVRLFNSLTVLEDEVYYLPSAPWPEAANGQGATLELIDPILDNSLPESWLDIHEYGSPGITNVEIVEGVSHIELGSINYYPNPFKDQINVTFEIQETTHLQAALYNSAGGLVHVFLDKTLNPGKYHMNEHLGHLNEGIYWLEIKRKYNRGTILKWIKF